VTTLPGRFQKALHLGFRQEVLATTIHRLFFLFSRHR
jgi:hypothetical protein